MAAIVARASPGRTRRSYLPFTTSRNARAAWLRARLSAQRNDSPERASSGRLAQAQEVDNPVKRRTCSTIGPTTCSTAADMGTAVSQTWVLRNLNGSSAL
jgi:hypothetical protein